LTTGLPANPKIAFKGGCSSIAGGDSEARSMKSNAARGWNVPSQGELFVRLPSPLLHLTATPTAKAARIGAFGDNMKLPVHRWFRYSAGFSADWARKVIVEANVESCRVLDPFAGSGTTLLAAQEAGADSLGFEAHPFVARIARAKLGCQATPEAFEAAVRDLIRRAEQQSLVWNDPPPLLSKCYTAEALNSLYSLRESFQTFECSHALRELVWLAITSILRECSYVGTAQWQYVLPNKTKAKTKEPSQALRLRAADMAADMRYAKQAYTGMALICEGDARCAHEVKTGGQFDLVVTSPPYPNNYDYADATRLEMSFWGDIRSWGELHSAVRHKLICSCSQHSSAEKLELDELLENPAIAPIRKALTEVCRHLEKVRETKGGKKSYHTMIAAYFIGLAEVWHSLRPMMKNGSDSHFVIGDSAPYGVYAPCDLWLGELALAAGFKSFEFEKLRDRNTKWKNRKHTIPLKEGILRVRG
jgi:16S rRNA G966 N2-methylase RsmD